MLPFQTFVIIFVASVATGRAAVVNITKLAGSDEKYDRNITRIPFDPVKDLEETTTHPEVSFFKAAGHLKSYLTHCFSNSGHN